jgi:phospholipase C
MALSWLGTLAMLAGCAENSASPESQAQPYARGQSEALSFAGSAARGAAGKIKHVVIVLQENRSPDNLFHGLPGADIANSGLDSNGNTIVLHEAPLQEPYDFGHIHHDFIQAYDNGKMDGTNLDKYICVKEGQCKNVPPNPNYAYIAQSDVQEYFTLAEQYVFGDRMFQTNQGESYPAHQMIIAGTSAPTADSKLFVSENPLIGVGCTARSDANVLEIDPSGNESQTTYPCFEHQTLMDLLDAREHSWKYYTNRADSIWNAPNSIKHIRLGSGWQNVIVPESQVLNDISSGTLADVSWVNPNSPDSDHPGNNNGTGPAWVASIVNGIGGSAYWKDTAIFISWDDWGGWYDHVPPKIINSYEYGFRVPLIVVSPYAKRAYVSHVTHDFGSILKFTEKAFDLGSLGYADSSADDLYDCFNFQQKPRKFQPIKTRYDVRYLLEHRGPSLPVDTD